MKKIPILIAIMAGCVLSMVNAEPMTLVYNTNLSEGTTVTLPFYRTVNVTVDWGDGSSPESFTSTGLKNHTYASEGTYTVSINGILTQFGSISSSYTNTDKLTAVISFGDIGLTHLFGAFYNAVNLTAVPTILPSSVTFLNGTFYGATSFNQNIGGWNVSNVTDIGSMFYNATSFNQNIGSWDVSSVISPGSMFYCAKAFNQDIGGWDVSKVTDISFMFYGATSFNQDISSWDVSNVEYMYSVFDNATAFNQNIGSWNVSSVGEMHSMFSSASAFNQDISSWDVSRVYDMSYMFYNAKSFNQNISNWNVHNVNFMNYMFESATSFNQNIGGWDVSNVWQMGNMFKDASAFNQNISDWNISAVTTMSNMFSGVTLSLSNYNALLTGWAAQTVKSGVSFDGGNSRYSSGAPATARQSLIDTYGWTITDGGQDASLPVDLNSFSAVCEGQSVILSWITESETDNLGYILERSQDGESWTTVASYQTNEDLKGQGNSSSKTEYTFTDNEVEPGAAYQYRLSDVSTEGEITVYSSLSITLDALPEITEMEKAYPNPFNPTTYISYHLAEDSQVKITVFDLLGRQVKTLYSGQQLAGSYQVYWNGKNENNSSAPTGTYLICMQTEDTKQVQKVMLLK